MVTSNCPPGIPRMAVMARRMQGIRRQPVGWRAQKRWPHAQEEAARV